ncbi:diphosphomevalonate decarboxylase [Coccinella septempunctata]|uniref:diphosphomevalonate decarboxylase n=1 Tax=Coccinella septempunctata TaxID=41139 RepID=UPI001D05F66E|nr:diphosphomevalonate decarboxylase [Coccinella septempunctata]
MNKAKIVTCQAPVNIAVIKYWGKRNDELILPINDSISASLCLDHMCAKTTIIASPDFKETKFWLNGELQPTDNRRLQNCLKEMKKRANSNLECLKWHLNICSENNFPTAAGLASSAAGYACLVYALSQIYEIKTNISSIARIGSGSACRSVFGGWVRWYKGETYEGSDSVAEQVAPETHWPEMRVLILVVDDQKKTYSSTSGMKTSVETSEFLQYRAAKIVPQRIEDMVDAIKNKNFQKFAQLTMQDSNQFHSVCLDTYPPCFYLNDTSRTIIELVHHYNQFKGEIKVAYTFDAGPNACLYLLEENVSEVVEMINYVFPPKPTIMSNYFKGIDISITTPDEKLISSVSNFQQTEGKLKYIIYTKVGRGPRVLEKSEEHLLTESGMPKH